MPRVKSSKRAFTIFELLLVITLISILYGIFVQKLDHAFKDEQRTVITLDTLKEVLTDLPKEKVAELICKQPCGTCEFYIDGVLEEALDEVTLFESDVFLYRLDTYGTLVKYELAPMHNENNSYDDLCFRYRVFASGASDHLVLEINDAFMIYEPLQNAPVHAATLAEANARYIKEGLLPMEKSDYDF